MNCPTLKQIEDTIKAKGYKWFENGDYNLNIVGVRNSETLEEVTNKFDDCITISYKVDGLWKMDCYPCTTDPGKYWVENLINEDGVAILKENQYRSTYQIGMHQGKYEALCQVKPVEVYRDDNLDNCYDLNEDSVQEGLFGINIHRATKYEGTTSTQVDKWSAGCQVIASNNNWQNFMGLCKQSRDIWGNSFTYTLINSDDLV